MEVARAVVGRPKLVLLDEPAAGLPEEETENLADVIRRIPERTGALTILVDHDMSLVSACCQTTAVLDFGNANSIAGYKNALYANNLGFALYRAQRYDEAVEWFKKTIGIDPKRAVAYLNLGDALMKLNRSAEAREAYAKYLELAPQSKSAPDVKKKLDALPPTPD